MDEPRYCTDVESWRQFRAQRAVREWVEACIGRTPNIDLLVSFITDAMSDELEEYQNDHAYEHTGLDA